MVGVGLNAIDTLIPLAHFPSRGSKTEYTSASILPGGQAATTVIACQTWGLTTRYVGKLGDDHGATLHRQEFARAGVDARLITVPNAASPQSLILVDDGGERTVLCRRDERLLLQPSDLDRSWIVNARALLVDGLAGNVVAKIQLDKDKDPSIHGLEIRNGVLWYCDANKGWVCNLT